MNANEIGKFIYKLRTEKNLSQYQLAEMIPISRQAVSKWERGITIPDSSTLIRLSEIFDVSINELLAGKKDIKNDIKSLENITLNIIDDNNRKTKKIKRLLFIFISIIIIITITFLTYYFINSYNSIKVYKIEKVGSNFSTYNGIFITTKQKSYLRLGELDYENDIQIEQVSLYYTKDNKKKLIFKNENANILITDYYGYNEYFPYSDVKDIINNLYLEIIYNDGEKETLKLDVKRDFSNDNLTFPKTENIDTDNTNNNEKLNSKLSKEQEEIISQIKLKGKNNNDGYVYEINDDKKTISFIYYEENNYLIISETNDTSQKEWHYYMNSDNLSYIEYDNRKIIDNKENIMNDTNNGWKKINEDYINKYLMS